jgi:hypothetical protein
MVHSDTFAAEWVMQTPVGWSPTRRTKISRMPILLIAGTQGQQHEIGVPLSAPFIRFSHSSSICSASGKGFPAGIRSEQ